MRGPVHVLGADELERSGNRFSRMLDEIGVPRGGAIATVGANTPEYLASYRGAVWSGRYFTPMSWRWTPDEVAYVAANCEATALVADARWPELAAAAAPFVAEQARFAVGGDIAGFRSWSDVEAMPADPPDDPRAGAVMMYTSGTTGRPKGVRRPLPEGPPPSHNGRSGAAMLTAFLPDGSDVAGTTHLVTSPLYHAGPLTYCDGAALLGAQLVVMERFDAEHFLELVEQHAVSSTFLVPIHFVRLLRLPAATRERYDLSSLRLVVHGSAPVAVDVKQRMIDWLGPVLYEFYGGTEGGGIGIDSHTWLERRGSVGRPYPGRNLEVVILDENGDPAPPGTEGLVYFHDNTPGQEPFAYKDDPDKTASAWRDGRFTLGDIGYLDDDGYLYLCDRRSDVINSGGVNVYPAQIEAALLEHPAVADCCVVGVPDDEWGELVHAVVQPVQEDALTADDVIAHCRSRLAGYQVPRGVEFEPELPRTETGKLARRVIRDRYWAGRDRRI
jgi:long-chain acyl-CoA synthetase